AVALDHFVKRLRNKILTHRSEIVSLDTSDAEGDALLVAYGSVYRCARAAAREARRSGWSVGSLKLNTLWPLADEELRALAQGRRAVVVMENNMGQMYPYLKAEMGRDTEVLFLPPQLIGELHDVEYVLDFLKERVRC
ncbi:MAG: transketolase C-terminal domain-containing protein, partial [Chloroflexota bacterium]|nr:transketolase C-terminal domain-containing protein [Chloroflexota bacterium]